MSKKTKDRRETKSGKHKTPVDQSLIDQEPESLEKGAEQIKAQPGDEGYEAWLALGPTLEVLVRRSDKLPSVDISVSIEEMRSAQKDLLEGHLDEIRACFNPDIAKMIDLVLGRQDQVCSALLYCEDKRQIEGSDVVEGSKAQIDALYQEALGYQVVGFNWLPVLKSAGLIKPETSARVQAGHGKKNTASDIRILGEHFDLHWELLKPLQKAQEDPSLRLTPEIIKRMRHVGGKLTDALAGKRDDEEPDESIDWRDQVIALYQLLEDDYHVIRETANFYFRFYRRFEDDSKLNTLKGFHMSKARKSSSKRAKRSKDEKTSELPSPDETKPEETKPDEATKPDDKPKEPNG
jgi:hypothetical protein